MDCSDIRIRIFMISNIRPIPRLGARRSCDTSKFCRANDMSKGKNIRGDTNQQKRLKWVIKFKIPRLSPLIAHS